MFQVTTGHNVRSAHLPRMRKGNRVTEFLTGQLPLLQGSASARRRSRGSFGRWGAGCSWRSDGARSAEASIWEIAQRP